MKYAEIMENINSKVFRRQDFLGEILKSNPNYNVGSFNRHFSKLSSSGLIECVGEDLYTVVTPDTARQIYTYQALNPELSDVEAFLNMKFPLVDFVVWETVQLNEFLNHQIAQNTIIVMVERMLMDAVFEQLKLKFPSTLFTPKPDEYQRYWRDGTVLVEKLSSRYPKNPKQRRRCSIEKLIVDLFAEKTVKAIVSISDYPEALEIAFMRYIINETRMFNYAKSRYVDKEIRRMIKNQTSIRLYT